MKYPDKVDVFGISYKIIYCKNMSDVDPSGIDRCFGHLDKINRVMRIFKGSDDDIWVAIYHEIYHAVADAIGSEEMDKDEIAVDFMARQQYAMNKEMGLYDRSGD